MKILKALNHNMADYHAIMERFQERAEEIKQKKMNLYEDYRAGHVSREEYLIKKPEIVRTACSIGGRNSKGGRRNPKI